MADVGVMVMDRRRSPVGDAVADWWTSWSADPLERVMLVAVVLVSACLLLVLATKEDAAATDDPCVARAVDDARAFAHVLGDDRFLPVSFAERACAVR